MKNCSKFLLAVYFIAFAALPLSYIHVEDRSVASRFIDSGMHYEENLHLFLHELFFAHFSQGSDHINNPPLERVFSVMVKKQRLESGFGSSFSKYFGYPGTFYRPAPNVAAKSKAFFRHLHPLSGYRPLLSGLSPPSL